MLAKRLRKNFQTAIPSSRPVIYSYAHRKNSSGVHFLLLLILFHSCSGALEIAISALADPGLNILLPSPGFSLYQTICNNKAVQARYYRLIPERDWEIDLDQLRSLIDANTVAILINSPSNPCGSLFSRQHLVDLVKVAEYYHLPIISDDVYSEMVFEGNEYVSVAEVSSTVPIISVGGMAKRYMVPGTLA